MLPTSTKLLIQFYEEESLRRLSVHYEYALSDRWWWGDFFEGHLRNYLINSIRDEAEKHGMDVNCLVLVQVFKNDEPLLPF